MKIKSTLALVILALFTAFSAQLSTAQAQGSAFTYQGQLQNNESPASSIYYFAFSLFNTNTGGSGISLVVSWPDTGNYNLQQNSNLATGSWAASGYTVTTANGTNSVTITSPTGNLFFRLQQ